MKTILFLVFFIMIGSFSCFGQIKMTGKVTDSKLTPIVGANVTALKSDSAFIASVVTGKDGKFKFKTNEHDCLLRISEIGYKTYQIHIKSNKNDVDLGNVKLERSSQKLKNVTVRNERIVNKMNKMLVFPTDMQIKESMSGLDLLKNLQLPLLHINLVNRSISLIGRNGVALRIDGVPASMKEVVQLQASRIAHIEYQMTPTGRELFANTGVINIILKKQEVGTYLFAEGYSGLNHKNIDGSFDLKTIYGKSQFTLDYDGKWSRTKELTDQQNTYNFPLGDKLNIQKKGHPLPIGNDSHDIMLTYEYKGDKNMFSAKLDDEFDHSFADRDMDMFIMQNNHQTQAFRSIRSKAKSQSPTLNLYHIFKINKEAGIETNLVGSINQYTDRRQLTDNYTDKKEYVNNNNKFNSKGLTFETYYYNHVDHIDYSGGIRAKYDNSKNIYDGQHVHSSEYQISPYITFVHQIKNFMYQVSGTLLSDNAYTNQIKNSNLGGLTGLSLNYNLKKFHFQYNFNYGLSTPSLSSLTPANQRIDSLTVQQGNPYLRASHSISNSLIIYYQTKKILPYFYIQQSRDYHPIANNYFYDTTIHSFVSKPFNQEYFEQYQINPGIHFYNLFNRLDLSLAYVYFYYASKGLDYKHQLNSGYVQIDLNANLFKNFYLNAAYESSPKSLSGEVISQETGGEYHLGLLYNYKNFKFALFGNCLFTKGEKYYTKNMSSAMPSEQYFYTKSDANSILLRVSYYLHWGKSIFNINKKLSNSAAENSGMKIKD